MPGVVKDFSRANTQVNGFSTADKERFCETLAIIGQLYLTCQSQQIAYRTFKTHYELDEQFRDGVDEALVAYKSRRGERIREVSYKLAEKETPSTFLDRIATLKALFPSEYDPKSPSMLINAPNSQLVIAFTTQNPCRPDVDKSANPQFPDGANIQEIASVPPLAVVVEQAKPVPE